MSKYSINFTSQFKKDLKLAEKQHKNLDELFNVIDKLANGEILDYRYHDHPLKEKFNCRRDYHIESDFVLIYQIFKEELVLMLYRIGSHSDLFE